jgi:hypothetical protein
VRTDSFDKLENFKFYKKKKKYASNVCRKQKKSNSVVHGKLTAQFPINEKRAK